MVSHAEVVDVAKEGGRNMVHLQWDDGSTSWEAAAKQPGPLRVLLPLRALVWPTKV